MREKDFVENFKQYKTVFNEYFEGIYDCINGNNNFDDLRDVILLCAGERFEKCDKDCKYLGGPDRQEAAIKIALKKNIKRIIVVGGGIEKEKEKEKYLKVDYMFKFLEKRGVEKEKIVKVISEADTHSNLRAIYKLLIDHKIEFKHKKIGIITNLYHMPRTLKFAKDTFKKCEQIEFIPISAELILKEKEDINIYQKQMIKRICEEINGLKDWNDGNYSNQKKEFNYWRGELID